MIRLISWNVADRPKGKKKRVAALLRHAPDIVALQGVTPDTARRYRKHLRAGGLRHVAHSFMRTSEEPVHDPIGDPTGELVAARWPLTSLDGEDFLVPWPNRVLSVRVDVDEAESSGLEADGPPSGADGPPSEADGPPSEAGGPRSEPDRPRAGHDRPPVDQQLELHVVHVPCGADHPREKVATLEGIYDALAEQSSIPRVLCGDLDAPQMELLSGTLVTWGERISDDGAVELASQDGRLDQAERNVLVGLAAFDLADVYRRLHGYEPQGYSWYATSGGVLESVPVGRRFAHVFASAVLQPVHCWYLHELREEGFSDHSPLLVDFDV